MIFNNKKLSSIEQNNLGQENQISLQKSVQTQIEKRTLNSQPREQVINSNFDFSSDWVDMNEILDNQLVRIAIWQTWNIPIGLIDYRNISNFLVEFVVRNGEEGDGDSSGFEVSNQQYFKKIIGWDIKDVVDEETSNIKNVTLIASIYAYKYITIPLFQSKLLVTYTNNSERF